MQPLGGERQSSHRSERKLSTQQEQRQLICSWYFGQGKSKSRCVLDHAKFFKALGQRVKDLRKRRGYSQEDMIAFGFSARHWQLRIFTFFHPGIFTIIHPPPGFVFKFLAISFLHSNHQRVVL